MAVAFLAAAQQANAVTYGDSSNDVFTAAGGGILDIQSVEVNNTATDLIFKINIAGDPVATDWGKYMVAIDSVVGGDTTNNGWGRPISMSSGMDYWIGSWVDAGNGIENRNWTNPGWPLIAASYGPNPGNVSVSKDSSSVTVSVKLADWGLSVGNSFFFDVYTSGGGGTDGAVDALANPSQTIADWGNSYDSALTESYTVVPEPSTLALAAFGGLALIGRIFRRRK
jgi:hypothetical protein